VVRTHLKTMVVGFVYLAATVAAFAPAGAVHAAVQTGPQVSGAVHMDTSPPLTQIAPQHDDRGSHVGHRAKPVGTKAGVPGAPSASSSTAIPATSTNFDGIGNGFSGPNGTFTVNSAPPDTNLSVGPNQIVEIVNTDFAVFNKTGGVIYGPVAINTLWSGFGGGCQTNNDGDPIVKYDSIANRWVITQFSVSTTPYLECVAVSTTGDPTGSYNRYSFSYGNTAFPDYPKLAVWPDAYYITFNIFTNGSTFAGAELCAYDRSSMLAGSAATQQCFMTSTSFGGVLPSDVDGSRQPPAGSPNYLLSLGISNNDLAFWKFHVDWATPANSTLTGPATLTVGTYAAACNGGTCIPQSGTRQQLDSLADRVMYRLAYRNFGDHEALVVNHSVTAGSSVGVRWYELRSPGGDVSVYQQGTFAPDSSYRWMGSIAMDQAGDIGLGYSVSSSSMHPAIRYTGRLAGDALGTMSQGEGSIVQGPGSQTGQNLSRWGDYSALAVDPADDCTFWYANEYIPSNGAFNWKTRIASFKFPGCTVVTNDFSISASPASGSVTQGGSTTTTVSTATTSGSAQTVNLSASGAPAGAGVSFNPASVTSGGSSTMTVNSGTAAAGTYAITVTGTGTSATHSTTYSLTINAPPDFSISVSPASDSTTQGGSTTATVSTATTSGAAQAVSLSASGAPSGAGVSFNPASVTSGGSSTMTVNSGTAAAGTYAITVTGTGTSTTHSASYSLTINAPPANDFSISASPASGSANQGDSTTSTIGTAITAGSAQTVNLSASGAPSGAAVSFNPASISSGGSSTMTVSTGTAAPGTYTITVTGTGTSATHSTTFALTVNSPGGIVNGGFESGSLSGWTASGATSISTTAHSGGFSAMVGSSSPFNGDSSIAQTFNVPAGSGTLSFWYRVVCPDTVTYDWATATLKDNTAGTSSTVLGKTCSNSGVWVQVTAPVTAGHSYTLTLINHDDNYPADPTYTLYDDVALSAPPPPPPPSPIVNGGFETGSLSGWTTTGATAVSTTAHTGSFSAMVGSGSPFNGDSSIAQTFTAPAGSTKLSFWYQVHCTDTVTFDWATATLKDNTTNTTTAVLGRTCTNSGAWVQQTASITAGHSYTVTLIDHDDNYFADPTYTLYDDVATQ